jgi:fructose-1,6-bisphosphatase/inositol monophosphatase family enzyme
MERFEEARGGEQARGVRVSFKGRNNPVTEVDLAAEVAATAVLAREYPGFGLLAEESGRRSGAGEFTWVLDPIDGTRNFANGVPHFAVNLALVQGDVPLLGLTYDPVRGELFSASAGQGAFLNGKRLAVSSVDTLEQSLLAFDLGYVDDQAAKLLEMLLKLWPNMQSLRITGSAALGLAYVAAGRYALYAHHHLYPWDVAPGLLLVAEAGGLVTDILGAPAGLHRGNLIAASPTIHSQFLAATEGAAWRRIS